MDSGNKKAVPQPVDLATQHVARRLVDYTITMLKEEGAIKEARNIRFLGDFMVYEAKRQCPAIDSYPELSFAEYGLNCREETDLPTILNANPQSPVRRAIPWPVIWAMADYAQNIGLELGDLRKSVEIMKSFIAFTGDHPVAIRGAAEKMGDWFFPEEGEKLLKQALTRVDPDADPRHKAALLSDLSRLFIRQEKYYDLERSSFETLALFSPHAERKIDRWSNPKYEQARTETLRALCSCLKHYEDRGQLVATELLILTMLDHTQNDPKLLEDFALELMAFGKDQGVLGYHVLAQDILQRSFEKNTDNIHPFAAFSETFLQAAKEETDINKRRQLMDLAEKIIDCLGKNDRFNIQWQYALGRYMLERAQMETGADQKGDYLQVAEGIFEELRELDPDDSRYVYYQGLCHLHQGRYEDALENLMMADQMEDDFRSVHHDYYMAEIYYHLNYLGGDKFARESLSIYFGQFNDARDGAKRSTEYKKAEILCEKLKPEFIKTYAVYYFDDHQIRAKAKKEDFYEQLPADAKLEIFSPN